MTVIYHKQKYVINANLCILTMVQCFKYFTQMRHCMQCFKPASKISLFVWECLFNKRLVANKMFPNVEFDVADKKQSSVISCVVFCLPGCCETLQDRVEKTPKQTTPRIVIINVLKTQQLFQSSYDRRESHKMCG